MSAALNNSLEADLGETEVSDQSKASAFPETVQSGIPQLPDRPPIGWKRTPLSFDLYEEKRPVDMQDDEEYDLVTVKRGRNGVVKRERKYGADISVKTQFEVKTGDFLISKRQIVHGACGIVPPELAGSTVSNEYAVLRSRGAIDLEFLKFLSHSVYFQQTCFHSSIGVHIEKMIFKTEKWLAWEFDLPPLAEQSRIAEIISTWDRSIEAIEKLIANSQAQKKALMQQLLTGKKRLPGFSGEWKSYKLSELEDLGQVHLGRGNVISRKDISSTPGPYPIYSSSVKGGGLFGTYGNYMFEEELITWSVDGGGDFFYRPKHKFSVTNVCGWMRLDTSAISYLFLAEQLKFLHSSLNFDYQMKAHPSVIRQVYVLGIPPLDEQRAIGETLMVASLALVSLQSALCRLKTEKTALMQQLLTGKRRVKLSSTQEEAA